MSNTRTLNRLIDESIRRRKAKNPNQNAFGTYWEKVNGVLVAVHDADPIIENILPTQGIHNCLDVWLGGTAKAAGSYLALYANAVNPAANWTASNVASTSGEITSTSQGYTQATRPQFTPNAAGATVSGSIDNVGQEAVFTINGTGPVNIEGVFLITNNTRGGTTGVLLSAARYPSTRVLQDDDDYRLGYRVTITS